VPQVTNITNNTHEPREKFCLPAPPWLVNDKESFRSKTSSNPAMEAQTTAPQTTQSA